MEEVSPTRSVVLELKEEQRAMREGHAFLDEKCLLLAGEILRHIRRYNEFRAKFDGLHQQGTAKLRALVRRHGLDGAQCYPAPDLTASSSEVRRRKLMGVLLQEAEWHAVAESAPAANWPSPEAVDCGLGYRALLAQAAQLAAISGNLERLYQEYRRASRRARALQDVLLPVLDQTVGQFESRLEELEQEDSIWVRLSVRM